MQARGCDSCYKPKLATWYLLSGLEIALCRICAIELARVADKPLTKIGKGK